MVANPPKIEPDISEAKAYLDHLTKDQWFSFACAYCGDRFDTRNER